MSEPLSVSLDVSAVPRQAVGVGRFALDLVGCLSRREDVELTLWSRRDDPGRWASAAHAGSAVVRAVAPSVRPLRLAWEQLRLPRLLAGEGFAVHHGPHYTMPERARLPMVVTVHDLTFVDHPEWHERTKVPVFRRAIKVAAARATAVLCDSRRTAARFEELCRPAGRVFVVPLGVDLERFAPAAARSGPGPLTDRGANDEVLLRSLSVRQPYVLFLGTLEPRKAVPELVAAFDQVAGVEPDLSLVLVGKPGWGASEVSRQIADARHRERVVRTGYVPDEAVPALLRCATVVAYPAKEEGFGLPALEALACGAPLVTTAGTVMAELAGAAALTVAPGSVGELATALGAVLHGDGVEERRRLGIEVASNYSWEASAAAHVAAYRWAAGTRSPGSPASPLGL
ncbi:MAG TPA: glycosyltransferase family 1 protein [Acidimicrobiales bacterium]|nr:glycosyltransferase family 1 protein [Acidimicrobiales bacterium]